MVRPYDKLTPEALDKATTLYKTGRYTVCGLTQRYGVSSTYLVKEMKIRGAEVSNKKRAERTEV